MRGWTALLLSLLVSWQAAQADSRLRFDDRWERPPPSRAYPYDPRSPYAQHPVHPGFERHRPPGALRDRHDNRLDHDRRLGQWRERRPPPLYPPGYGDPRGYRPPPGVYPPQPYYYPAPRSLPRYDYRQ